MEKPQLKKDKPTTGYKGGLPTNMIALINRHIEAEAFSSQIYLQMGSWCDVQGYTGAAKFFRKHYFEERNHMIKLYDFLSDKNIVATTPAIPAPDKDYVDLGDVIQTALEHEFVITSSYEKDCELSLAEPCHQTFELLQWFIHEQVEEEALFQTIVDKYNLIKKYGITGAAILEFDDYLGSLA